MYVNGNIYKYRYIQVTRSAFETFLLVDVVIGAVLQTSTCIMVSAMSIQYVILYHIDI